MKISLNKFLLIILFILNVSCKSGNKITDTSPPSNSECIDGQSMGCDDICSITPLQIDACGECGGDGATCEGNWNVFYNGSVPIAGFQFHVTGVDVTGAGGGAAEAAGLTVSTGNNTVLGFSLQGTTIPVGEGVLVVLDIPDDGDACLEDLVISDASGNALEATVENCNTICYDKCSR